MLYRWITFECIEMEWILFLLWMSFVWIHWISFLKWSKRVLSMQGIKKNSDFCIHVCVIGDWVLSVWGINMFCIIIDDWVLSVRNECVRMWLMFGSGCVEISAVFSESSACGSDTAVSLSHQWLLKVTWLSSVKAMCDNGTTVPLFSAVLLLFTGFLHCL